MITAEEARNNAMRVDGLSPTLIRVLNDIRKASIKGATYMLADILLPEEGLSDKDKNFLMVAGFSLQKDFPTDRYELYIHW